MAKTRGIRTNETVSKPIIKPKAQLGKNDPLTDSLDWKKPFEKVLKGKSDDIFTPIREVFGKLTVDQIKELTIFLSDRVVGDGSILNLFENSPTLGDLGFDHTKPKIPISDEQFSALIEIFRSFQRDSYDLDTTLDTRLEGQALATLFILAESRHQGAGDLLFEIAKVQATSDNFLGDGEHLFPLVSQHIKGTERAKELSGLIIGYLKKEKISVWLDGYRHPLSENHRSFLEQAMDSGDIRSKCACLAFLGAKEALPTLKTIYSLAHESRTEFLGDYELCLIELGFTGGVQRLLTMNRSDEVGRLLTMEDQKSAYSLLAQNRDIKQLVLEGSDLLESLPNPQAWITVNNPELARESVRIASQKLGPRINKLDNVLSQSLGVRSKNLKSTHFTFYADEILDAVFQVSQMKQLKDDPGLSAVLSQAKYSNGVKFRFARREKSDLSLGDKCGDCTAKGSVNFGNSVTWLINPAYNIIKMSSGKHFIGKMNITLGTIAGGEAVIIDALEFNPQAAEGKPLYDEAVNCFEEAISFLKQLAESQNRSLFALTFSNSSGAQMLLRKKGFHPMLVKGEGITFLALEEAAEKSKSINVTTEKLAIQLLIPSEDILRIMESAGYSGSPKLFYQMVDTADTISTGNSGGNDMIEEKLPLLEREVINPAQIENPEIAKAMRERDFEKAARLIFADENGMEKFRGIFNLNPSMRISPMFLAKKMEKIYAADAADMDSLRKTVTVEIDRFVKL